MAKIYKLHIETKVKKTNKKVTILTGEIDSDGNSYFYDNFDPSVGTCYDTDDLKHGKTVEKILINTHDLYWKNKEKK